MEGALGRCPSLLDRSKFDTCRLVDQLAEPALDGPARSVHCALSNVRYVCPYARARPRLLRLCVVLPCQRDRATTDMASREGAEPSLNLLDTEIMIGEVGAKVSRSLL